MSESEPNGKSLLYQKLARVMGSLNRLPQNGYNKFFNYRFVTESDIADAVREKLAEQNVAFFASMTNHSQMDIGDDKKRRIHTVVEFEFTFACGDSGECVTYRWVGEAIGDDDKGLSKAATSAEKYFLLKTFILSSGDDPESDTTMKSRQKPPAQKPPPDTSLEESKSQHIIGRGAPPTRSNPYAAKVAASEPAPSAGFAYTDKVETALIFEAKKLVIGEWKNEVISTVRKMRDEGAFAAVQTFDKALEMVVTRVNSHHQLADANTPPANMDIPF